MTYPITPNPGIHIDPTAAVARQAAVQNELKALEGLFSQLPGQILNSIVNSILKALGWGNTSSTTPGGMAADIEQALTQLYNYAYTAATNLSALITNAEGQTIADLIAWLNTAQQAATDIEDFLTTGNWADLSAAWQEIVQAIFGTAASAPLTSWIPAAWVAKLPQNSHAVANFPNSSSVMAGGGWSWDSTVSYSGSAGSALFAASGNLGALRGIVIPVQPNQVVTMSAVVEWSGVTAASGTSPFQLQIIPWTATVEAGLNVPGAAGTPQNVASITSPASSASWTTLSGTYTVPSTGVGFVQVRLVVTADATAGSVWWNNCITTVSGGYLDTLENDLNTLQSDATASTEAFSNLLSSVESAITGYTNWSTFISAVESAWNTYTTTESNLLSSEIFTIQNFFSTLLGLNSSTGLISPGNISSATGLATLQADWNQWVSNIETTWNNLWGTSTVSSGQQVSGTNVSSSTGLASLEADWNQWVSNIEAGWNALWGVTTTPTTSSKVQSTSVASSLGGTNLNTDVTSVHTTAVNGSSWSTRLTNDLLVLSDVFHITYAAGSPSDPPGTLSGGKPTWYSCWNDLLALCGVVNSTTAPTDSAPTTGSSITAAQASATTAGTNASLAIANAQSITDTVINSQSGGSTTGQPISGITTALTNIPASNVVGSSPAAVAYGATGGGNAVTGVSSTLSTSWSHSIATGDGEVLIGISYAANAASTWASSCTYGGSSTGVTLLATIPTASAVVGTNGYTDVYVLKAPPSGSKTVAVTVTRQTGSGTVIELHGNSISYAASKVGTVNTYTGGGSTALSMTAASSTGKMVVGFFTSYVNNNNTLSSAFAGTGQNQRYNHGFITAGLASAYGDGPGASSVVFSATSPYSTQQYCGVTVEISN